MAGIATTQKANLGDSDTSCPLQWVVFSAKELCWDKITYSEDRIRGRNETNGKIRVCA